MSNEWITVQQRKLDEKITAEYIAATSPHPPDDEWIYELDNDAWGAWVGCTSWLPNHGKKATDSR
nr:hypothetical protein [uncultured Mediterranean phage uvMED]